ncbi:TetR family transcriptional regulator [Pseudactinotalea sp.]|uniref:TetR family transcriptional regulator n=1 Tax=Pseudactinotalea sp. TaxID=1926260 RepID=UPI003B3B6C46
MTGESARSEKARAQPRRQARGQQRIEQILHAAAAVFAERGYDAATTNAIAAHAGISPGSLYQFFTNKDDIARALADHYAGQLTALRAEAFTLDRAAKASLEDLVDAVLGPLMAFNLAHPGFKAIFARTDMPAGLREAVAPVQTTIHERVVDLLGLVMPDRPHGELVRTATVAIQIVRGMTPLITDASGPERDALSAELRTVLISYLRSRAADVPRGQHPAGT